MASAPDSPAQRRRLRATRASFFSAGVGLSAWAPLVPYARARLGADEAELGLLLLSLGLGSIVAMPLAGWAAARLGCRRLIGALALLCAATLPWLAVAPDHARLLPLLFVYGASLGSMDVAINLHAVLVERRAGRALMSGFHGCFSAGCIAGAGGITALLWLGAPPWLAVSTLAALIVLALRWFVPQLLAEGGERGASWQWPRGRLLALGAICFTCFLCEGAMLDWSALALAQLQQLPAARAGSGFALFALAMTWARFQGDHWVARHGPARLLSAGSGLLVVGIALAVWSETVIGALSGYVLAGLGVANIAPMLFSAAGRQARGNTQAAVAAVSTLGYAGSLAGPALIGLLAQASSLPLALSAVALTLAVTVIAGHRNVTAAD